MALSVFYTLISSRLVNMVFPFLLRISLAPFFPSPCIFWIPSYKLSIFLFGTQFFSFFFWLCLVEWLMNNNYQVKKIGRRQKENQVTAIRGLSMEIISPKSFLYSESVNWFLNPATISFLVLFFECPTNECASLTRTAVSRSRLAIHDLRNSLVNDLGRSAEWIQKNSWKYLSITTLFGWEQCMYRQTIVLSFDKHR